MGIPTVEIPPQGLDAYWLGAWRAALKQLKEQGTWIPAHKPLLDEYVRALRLAERAFDAGEGGDRHSKRALAYAVELGLTPRARKQLGAARKEAEDGGSKDPFAALDDPGKDELAPRRRRRKASG